eukprot:TRINITY_DN32256_c0_g1_i1.p1 TRINITY_DN32256_c0_g1~~TRINITY_DN32256_c0_g1_i1.p1  ORF type:complete len:321 (+),score=89.41 TRINITY_DN32256_c0_g1_i1:62-1024(+)
MWSWLAGGRKAEEKAADAPSLYHYGAQHHLDYYRPMPLGERAALEKAKMVKRREELQQSGSAEQRVEASLMEDRLDTHCKRVSDIRDRLVLCAEREKEYVYSPDDFGCDANISFEEWQRLEEEKLVDRRAAQLAVDKSRPEMNMRTAVQGMFTGLAQVLPGQTAGATEPGLWPRRRFYYPVTNFAMLPSIDMKSEEEVELERRCDAARWDMHGGYVMTAAAASFIYALATKHPKPFIPYCTCTTMGVIAEFGAAIGGAWKEMRDLDDFRVAKVVWFAKNRPEVFEDTNSGLVVGGGGMLGNPDSISGDLTENVPKVGRFQ